MREGKDSRPQAADVARYSLLAFAFGGAFAVFGQLLLDAWTPALGADHPLLGFAVLVSMGVIGVALFVTGLHQKLAPIAGFGLIFPFNGFCAAVSEAYVAGTKETGGVGGGFKAAVRLVGHVIGLGAVCVAVIAAFVNAMGSVM